MVLDQDDHDVLGEVLVLNTALRRQLITGAAPLRIRTAILPFTFAVLHPLYFLLLRRWYDSKVVILALLGVKEFIELASVESLMHHLLLDLTGRPLLHI